jgi:tRNA (cytosine34-C5)-methyltransferase
MPSFYEKNEDGSVNKEVKFDRVLCDVPCSGDGTLRKNTEVWKSWNAANGNNFHGLQFKIAKRGLEMLAKDGLMAYSTCSLNPQEDEAVVAALLREAKAGIELVDVSHVLPHLKCKPGLQTWNVMTRDMKVVLSVDDVPEKSKTQIRETMFPPSDENIKSQLKRCIRILPHLQDTGGFFVAVFRKNVDNLDWQSSIALNDASEQVAEIKKEDEANEEPVTKKAKYGKKVKKEGKKKGFKEDPFLFFENGAPEWPEMKNFYKINSEFPYQQLMYRNSEGRKRNIYFLTKAAKKIITDNEDKVRFVNAGARLFARNTEKDFDCEYRLTQDGLPSVFNFIDRESMILLTFEDMKNLLKEDNYPMDKLSEGVKNKVKTLPIGSCILLFKTVVDDQEVTVPLCGWRGVSTLRPYIAKTERMHFLRICGVDPRELEEENRQVFLERQARKEARLNRELESRKQLLNEKEGRDGDLEPVNEKELLKQELLV